jgi:hypothetical protein
MSTTVSISAIDYIRIDSLPLEQREPFAAWIFHQTCPVIPHEIGVDGKSTKCVYRWDYGHWLVCRQRGEIAVPLD